MEIERRSYRTNASRSIRRASYLRFITASIVITHLTITLAIPCHGESKTFDFQKTASVELPSKKRFLDYLGSYVVDVDFGRLPANKRGSLTVIVSNPENFDIPIQNVRASCGCTKAQLMNNLIPSDGSVKLQVEITPPSRHVKKEFESLITLEIDRDRCAHPKLRNIHLKIKFVLAGLLCFQDRLVTVDLNDSERSVMRVPIINTVDTELQDLVINTTGSLVGVSGNLGEDEQGHCITLQIDPNLLAEDRGHGRIFLSDPSTGVSDRLDVVIRRAKTIKLSPQHLRFAPDDNEKGFVCNAILRVDRPEPRSSSSTQSSTSVVKKLPVPTLAFESFIGGKSVHVTTKQISGKIFRLRLSLSKKQIEELHSESTITPGTLSMQWRAITGKLSESGEVPVLLTKDALNVTRPQ